jgi:hypothetical protein
MKILLTLLTLFIGIVSYSQDLNCNDFKKGKFFIPINGKTDTLFVFNEKGIIIEKVEIPNEKSLKRYVVERNKNSQIEWNNNVNNEKPVHQKIEWIGKCKYTLKKDENKHRLNDDDLFIINNGGLIVEKIEIKGKCMKYKSTVEIKNNGGMYLIGKICKE